MSATPDPVAEFRSQRHEFILHYYDMAVSDLESHLKVGWETMATSAAAIVTLSLGYQQYLPIPVATAAAFAVSFWGIMNIIDADYWATRAIAFLANVEAVYFYQDDQRVFNLYAGKHPPFEIMDSLKSQLYATISFLLISVVFFASSVAARVGSLDALEHRLAIASAPTVLLWLFPIILFIVLLDYTFLMRKKRVSDYLAFVTGSPGPGIVTNRTKTRGVTLDDTSIGTDVIAGSEVQRKVREALERANARWGKWYKWVVLFSILLCLVLLGLAVFRRCVFA